MPCAVKKPVSRQTDGLISVRYDNLLDINIMSALNSMSLLNDVENEALCRRFTGNRPSPAFYLSGGHGQNVLDEFNSFHTSENHRIL